MVCGSTVLHWQHFAEETVRQTIIIGGYGFGVVPRLSVSFIILEII